jgi:hypothetical protein
MNKNTIVFGKFEMSAGGRIVSNFGLLLVLVWLDRGNPQKRQSGQSGP